MKKYVVSLAVIVLLVFGAIFYHQKIIALIVLPQYIAWAEETEAAGLTSGTALDERQRVLAREIGISSPEKVRLVYVDEVPFPHDNLILKTVGEALGFIGDGIVNNAQVFGYSIYVRKGYPLTVPNLAHELVHVLQIEQKGLNQIITQHFSDLAQYGYENSPLEREAFAANERYRDHQ